MSCTLYENERLAENFRVETAIYRPLFPMLIGQDMWADDAHWMPLFLAGKFFKGEFDFSDEQTIVDYRLQKLPSSETIQI